MKQVTVSLRPDFKFQLKMQLKTRPFRLCKISILSASMMKILDLNKYFNQFDEKSAESLIQKTQEDNTK